MSSPSCGAKVSELPQVAADVEAHTRIEEQEAPSAEFESDARESQRRKGDWQQQQKKEQRREISGHAEQCQVSSRASDSKLVVESKQKQQQQQQQEANNNSIESLAGAQAYDADPRRQVSAGGQPDGSAAAAARQHEAHSPRRPEARGADAAECAQMSRSALHESASGATAADAAQPAADCSGISIGIGSGSGISATRDEAQLNLTPPGQHTVIELSDSNQAKQKRTDGKQSRPIKSASDNNNKSNNNNNNNHNPDCKWISARNNCPAAAALSKSEPEEAAGEQAGKKAPNSSFVLEAAPSAQVTEITADHDDGRQQALCGSKAEAERIELQFNKRPRRLSGIQSLLLRKWPYSALAVCIVSSLLFAMLLSALTVVFLRALLADQCLSVASVASGSSGAAGEPMLGPTGHALLALEMPGARPSAAAELFGSAPDAAKREPPVAAVVAQADSPLASRARLQAEQIAKSQTAAQQFRRLPETLFPEHYDLFVWPHLDTFVFDGSVRILLECRQPTSNITLHVSEPTVERATIELEQVAAGANQRPTRPKVRRVLEQSDLQHLIIELEAPLERGQRYLVSMNFTGKLNDDLAGFYKIKYERPNSTEPTSPDGLWVTDSFGKSQRMSTYLVAFAVTNFESRSEGNISVWTRPGFVHTAEYALRIAGKILRHYEQFFGIEYPLPKMDMIALPDFNAGAMENWGLITYRETAMLYDESSSSVANKQRVAVVVAHELAHQWFGNLVTPKWWDDLWLNEGFASFVEYIGVDHVEPKWRMLDQFVVEEVQNVFKVDSLSSSHQISIPVNNPDEINEIFDHISYAKGASIIRMISHFLTEKVFKLGLQRYLRALKYSNAEQSDLWAHLTEAQRWLSASNGSAAEAQTDMINVERVMNSWTLQTGYPLVTLTRRYNALGATLEQARYQPYRLQQNASVAQQQQQQKWEIPITYTWRSDQNWTPKTRLWMHQNSSGPLEVQANMLPLDHDDWIIVNLNQVGYYRVNYDQRNWRLLIKQLLEDHNKIGTTNRAQLLDDMFELAKSSILDYNFAMEATKYLKSEREYLPWDSVLLSFAYIDDMLQRSSIYGDWQDYVAQLIEPYYGRYRHLEWTTAATSDAVQPMPPNVTALASIEADDVLEQYNQVNAIVWACQVQDHCIKRAVSVFRQWRESKRNTIRPALRYTVYCTAIENGNKDDWDFLWRAYESEQNASERDRIMRALGCSKELWILSRYLDWIFDKSKPIRRQDGAYVFRMIAKNNYGRDLAFNFMRERWATIREFYGKTSFSLGNLIRSISTSMNTQVELQQLQNFYETIKADVGTGKRSFQIAIEEVESNVNWRNKNYKILEDWLQKEKQSRLAASAAH